MNSPQAPSLGSSKGARVLVRKSSCSGSTWRVHRLAGERPDWFRC